MLPIVVNGKTSLHTLTQSFYVTKVVEAVKTVPAGENYEFIATQAFKDFSNVLEEAGSEKREQLLPGKVIFDIVPTLSIRDFEKLNLICRFEFKLKSIVSTATAKSIVYFKSGQK